MALSRREKAMFLDFFKKLEEEVPVKKTLTKTPMEKDNIILKASLIKDLILPAFSSESQQKFKQYDSSIAKMFELKNVSGVSAFLSASNSIDSSPMSYLSEIITGKFVMELAKLEECEDENKIVGRASGCLFDIFKTVRDFAFESSEVGEYSQRIKLALQEISINPETKTRSFQENWLDRKDLTPDIYKLCIEATRKFINSLIKNYALLPTPLRSFMYFYAQGVAENENLKKQNILQTECVSAYLLLYIVAKIKIPDDDVALETYYSRVMNLLLGFALRNPDKLLNMVNDSEKEILSDVVKSLQEDKQNLVNLIKKDLNFAKEAPLFISNKTLKSDDKSLEAEIEELKGKIYLELELADHIKIIREFLNAAFVIEPSKLDSSKPESPKRKASLGKTSAIEKVKIKTTPPQSPRNYHNNLYLAEEFKNKLITLQGYFFDCKINKKNIHTCLGEITGIEGDINWKWITDNRANIKIYSDSFTKLLSGVFKKLGFHPNNNFPGIDTEEIIFKLNKLNNNDNGSQTVAHNSKSLSAPNSPRLGAVIKLPSSPLSKSSLVTFNLNTSPGSEKLDPISEEPKIMKRTRSRSEIKKR